MFEYLYDFDKAVEFINKPKNNPTKNQWIFSTSPLKNIGVKNIDKLQIQDLFNIIEDLESLCDNSIEIILSSDDVGTHFVTLKMINTECEE